MVSRCNAEYNVESRIIKAALVGIGEQAIILDAEMVAFSDERHAIDGQCEYSIRAL
jgi:hypothetical protein